MFFLLLLALDHFHVHIMSLHQDIKPRFLEEGLSVSFMGWTDRLVEDSDSDFHFSCFFGTAPETHLNI